MHVFVTGLARSDAAAQRIKELGAQALPGALEDTERLHEGARAADGVLRMAFGGSFADPFLARVFATDAPASSAHTRALLGWSPTHASLLTDLATGDYFAAQAA